MTAERGHRMVEHTADAAIEAWAPDLPALFEECAVAMFELMFGAVDPCDANIEVRAGGEGDEALLVAWLSELLFVAEVEGLALCAVAIDALDEDRVRGRVGGRLAGRGALQGPPVKAVTYHDLAIRRGDDFRTRVVFDV